MARLPSFAELCENAGVRSEQSPSKEPYYEGQTNLKTLLLAFNQDQTISNVNQDPNHRNYIYHSGSKSPSTGFSTSDTHSNINHTPESFVPDDDIARVSNVLHGVENANDAFIKLIDHMNAIGQRFMDQLENSESKLGSSQSLDEILRLAFHYAAPSGDNTLSRITCSDAKEFVENTTIEFLQEGIYYASLVERGLSKWLELKRYQEEKRNSIPTAFPKFSPGPRSLSECSVESPPIQSTPASASAPVSAKLSVSPPRRNLDLIEQIKAQNKKEKFPAMGIVEPLKINESHQVCLQCESDDTPEWRRGPYGPRTLCNACGLFYGKLIRKCGKEEAAIVMERRKAQGNGKDRRIPIE